MSHSVSHPLALARYELRRFRGPLPSLALVFILLIPLLYGCIYLAGNWDPYGNLGRVPVAVVNEDRPTSYGGQRITAGQDFVDSLHRAGTFDFSDTTAHEAEDGLREGRYYLVITVPQEFSADLVSGNGDHPQRAQIRLHRNDANGFVIGTITNSAQNSIARAIDETATGSYFESVFANLSRIRAGMQEAAVGARALDAGLAKAHVGAGTLSSGLARADQGASSVASGAAQLRDGIGQAASGAKELDDGLGSLGQGAEALTDGARRVADGTHQLTAAVDPVLELAAQRLPEPRRGSPAPWTSPRRSAVGGRR